MLNVHSFWHIKLIRRRNFNLFNLSVTWGDMNPQQRGCNCIYFWHICAWKPQWNRRKLGPLERVTPLDPEMFIDINSKDQIHFPTTKFEPLIFIHCFIICFCDLKVPANMLTECRRFSQSIKFNSFNSVVKHYQNGDVTDQFAMFSYLLMLQRHSIV